MKNESLRQIADLKSQKKYDEALKCALKGFKEFKDNCFYNEAYECCTALKKRKDAIKILKKMLKQEPDNVLIYKRLGYSFFVLGKFKEALKYYRRALDYEPLSSVNYFNVGSMYHYLKDYKFAKIYYEASIKIDKTNISSIANLGVLYYEIGEWKKAFSYFKYGIKVAPSHPEAYHHIGKIYREFSPDEELSILYLRKAAALDPGYSDNYYELALSYYKFGRTADAVVALKKCLEINPKHKNAMNMLKKM